MISILVLIISCCWALTQGFGITISSSSQRLLKLDSLRLYAYDSNRRNVDRHEPARIDTKDVWVQKVQKLYEAGNIEILVKTIKTLAYTSGEYSHAPSQKGQNNSNNNRNNRSDALDVSKDLMPIIADALPLMDAAMISDLLWSMGKLGFRFSVPAQREVVMDLLHRLCQFDSPSPRQITTSFGGLARLQMKWSHLQDSVKSDIIIAVGSVSTQLNDREIGNLLHSLGKLQVPWSGLPQAVQNGLYESFITNSKYLHSQQGSMAIYSLGTMGCELDRLPPAMRDHLFNVAYYVMLETRGKDYQTISQNDKNLAQQASNTIYGLAKMGAEYKQLPSKTQGIIEESLCNIMDKMNEQEVANTVYSMGVMGAKWQELPPKTRDTIHDMVVQRYDRMITQGVSNIIYGMGLMGINWHEMSDSYKDATHTGIVRSFKRVDLNGQSTNKAQAIANVLYAMGISGASWKAFPPTVSDALLDGIYASGDTLNSQELSNLIYGMGLLKTDYHCLPDEITGLLETNFHRISEAVNEQEVCSFLNGFAKMSVRWTEASKLLRLTIFRCILRLSQCGLLCLACTIYSLGCIGATWDETPKHIKQTFIDAALDLPLKDQTISNTIYGLSLMQVKWATLEVEMRDALLHNLDQPDVFSDDIAQHVSNSLWGLGKMDAAWSSMPAHTLEEAFNQCRNVLSNQEMSNAVYGMAIMDASWDDLEHETKESIVEGIFRMKLDLTIQETANLMYSVALMTFDADYSDPSTVDGQLLLKLHQSLITTYKVTDYSNCEKENYDQYGIYFELMRVLPAPYGNTMVMDTMGYLPRPTGPCGNVPSRLHAKTADAMLQHLKKASSDFDVFNEFNGLQGVFPVDCAVYYKDELVALVEVDGEFHYKQSVQLLRRKDQMKELIYRWHYPNIPLFRMRSDQIYFIGEVKAGQALAKWICMRVLKEEESAEVRI